MMSLSEATRALMVSIPSEGGAVNHGHVVLVEVPASEASFPG